MTYMLKNILFAKPVSKGQTSGIWH